MTRYADTSITEPLLQKLESVIDECLAANVDPDWIHYAVQGRLCEAEGEDSIDNA